MESVALRRKGIVTVLIGTMIAVVPVWASAATGQVSLEVPNASGTQFGFDVESASLAPATAASTDVRTHTNTSVGYRQLIALNGSGVAKLSTTDFTAVDCFAMRNASFELSVFTGVDGTTDPVPGTIYVVRSRVDGYAKMQLVSVKQTAPKGLVLDYLTSDCPSDTTPPEITPSISGPEGAAGWFVGPVDVSWAVGDAESEIISTEGCEPVTLADDGAAVTVTCSAASAGGASSATAEISIDATDPVVSYEGNRGVYELDEHVAINCVASDATSGVASDTCAAVDGPAHEFGPGEHHASAVAADVAGNEGNGSTSFEVIVTPGGVARLTIKLVSDGDLASQLQHKADKVASASNVVARTGALRSFENFANAHVGKGLDRATADLLISLVSQL